MKTFYIETFGCQMNAHDSEKVIGTLLAEGYSQVPTSVLSKNYPGSDPSLQPYKQDLAKAKQLLTEAGFPNGITKPIGLMVGVEKEYVDVTTAVQQQWSQAGIKSEIQVVERAPGDARRRNRDFDINVQAIARFDPSQYLLPYASGAGIPFPNIMNYKGADDFILKAVVEPDEAKRKELYIQAQRKIKEDCPIVPLYYPNFMIAIRPEIEGAKADPTRVYNVRDIRFKA